MASASPTVCLVIIIMAYATQLGRVCIFISRVRDYRQKCRYCLSAHKPGVTGSHAQGSMIPMLLGTLMLQSNFVDSSHVATHTC